MSGSEICIEGRFLRMHGRVFAISTVLLATTSVVGCAAIPALSHQVIGTAKVKTTSAVKTNNSSSTDNGSLATGDQNGTATVSSNTSASKAGSEGGATASGSGNSTDANGTTGNASGSTGGAVTPIDSPPANDSGKWTDPTTLPPIRYWNMNHYKSFAKKRLVPEIYSLPKGEVALSIDDGPSPYTAQILKILEKYHAHVTFFDVGKMIKQYPNDVKQAVKDGNLVEDHSMTHPSFFMITPKEQAQQIDQTAHLIHQLTGQPVRLFRPPYENFDNVTEQILQRDGMSLALWNRDPKDWKAKSSQQIVQAVLGNNPSGAVFDMHDKKLTLAALPAILRGLEKMNLKLVVLPTPNRSVDLQTGSKPIPLTSNNSSPTSKKSGQPTTGNSTANGSASNGSASNKAATNGSVANTSNSTSTTKGSNSSSPPVTNNKTKNTTQKSNSTTATGVNDSTNSSATGSGATKNTSVGKSSSNPTAKQSGTSTSKNNTTTQLNSTQTNSTTHQTVASGTTNHATSNQTAVNGTRPTNSSN